jgi:hypothetical protein
MKSIPDRALRDTVSDRLALPAPTAPVPVRIATRPRAAAISSEQLPHIFKRFLAGAP